MEPRVINYSDAFLKLNISGKRYKLLKSTALSLRHSVFAELAALDHAGGHDPRLERNLKLSPEAASSFYMIDISEFYLERSSIVFDYVLHYVYSGRLHCPNGICKEMLLEELEFWRVLSDDKNEDVKIAFCCEAGGKEHEEEHGDADEGESLKHPKTFLGRVWMCCEDPGSSVGASVLNIISILFILISIINLILSTVKALHHCKDPVALEGPSANITSLSDDVAKSTAPNRPASRCEGGPIFDIIEAVCIGWFTLELIVRFVSCPNKGRFFKSIMNTIDLLATVPYYIEWILWALNVNTGKLLVIYAFRLLRILRIMRALRLARYFDSIRIMGETLQKCKRDLSILLVFISMAMVISSSIVYYFERDEPDTPYTSIPMSFWWSIVTLTTVGYGDIAPATSGGRISAGVVCVVGIILMAMPISIMVEQFGQTYKSRRVKRTRVDPKDLLRRVAVAPRNTPAEGQVEDRKEVKYNEDTKLLLTPKEAELHYR